MIFQMKLSLPDKNLKMNKGFDGNVVWNKNTVEMYASITIGKTNKCGQKLTSLRIDISTYEQCVMKSYKPDSGNINPREKTPQETNDVSVPSISQKYGSDYTLEKGKFI